MGIKNNKHANTVTLSIFRFQGSSLKNNNGVTSLLFDPDVTIKKDFEYIVSPKTKGNYIIIDPSVNSQIKITLKYEDASISNNIKIFDKSKYALNHIITDEKKSFEIEKNKIIDFCFDGEDLIRLQSDGGGSGPVNIFTGGDADRIKLPVPDGFYLVKVVNEDNKTVNTCFIIIDNSLDSGCFSPYSAAVDLWFNTANDTWYSQLSSYLITDIWRIW